MADFPEEDLKWATNEDPNAVREPSPQLKQSGIVEGTTFGREHFNWLMLVTSKFTDWIRSYAMDKTKNLSELTNKQTARNNLGCSNAANLTSGTIPSARLPNATVTCTGDATGNATMTNLGDVSIPLSILSASTSQKGLVQLNNTTTSTSTTTAPTSNALNSLRNTATFSTNGQWKCGSTGLTVKWFRCTSTVDGTQTFTIPGGFPTACLGAGPLGLGCGANITFTKNSISLDRLNDINGSMDFTMLAIGY